MGKIISTTGPGPGETSTDVLTAVLRAGCHQLLQAALETEVEEFIVRYREERDERGRQRIVRNGYLPKREVQTGIGSIEARVPRVRNREPESSVRFSSQILPPYLRRSKSIEDLLPWLYLKGISTGDFSEALESLLGEDARGLSATTISRLKREWEQTYGEWSKRDLSEKRYVYIWADGVYFQARLEDARQCILVLMGSLPNGKKELIAIVDGYRESEASWLELLRDVRERGMELAPQVATGDGALGFWKALGQVFPETRGQLCCVHKTANVLNKLPKSLHGKANAALNEIWMAPSRQSAEQAMARFVRTYEAKYPAAVACLKKDEAKLLTFYDFPAEHWKHLRTTNPIESTFATVKLRTAKTRGCLSRTSALTMVFQLCRCAEKRWRKLDGYELLGKVIEGVRFVDGVEAAAA